MMKRKSFRKLLSILMAAVMLLSMSMTGFAATATENSGSITIKDSETVSVAGKTFNAYQILELTAYVDDTTGKVGTNGYVYTVPDALISFYSSYFNISTTVGDFSASVRDEIAKLKTDSTALYTFTTAALAAAKTAGITPSTVTAAEGDTSVSFTNLALGYYLIEDAGTSESENETISAVMLDTTDTSVTITLKAETPDLEKTITKTDDTEEDDGTTVNDVAVGGTVTYELTSTVPDMRGYTKYFFVINDTLSKGLTYAIDSEDDNNMVVKIGDHTLECASITVDGTDVSVTTPTTDYTYDLVITNNTDGTTGVKVIFKDFIQYADETKADITVTYTVTVNEDAEIGNTSNDNTATLIYSNNPNEKSSGSINPDEPDSDDPVGETPETETNTYVTGIQLTKVDPDNKALTGAVFTLEGDALKQVQVTTEVFVPDDSGDYWLLNDGTYTTTDPTTEGIDSSAYEDITTKYSKTIGTEWVTTSNTVTATATVNDNGILVFNGLSAGTYTITEIVSPDGYNLLDAPIVITIGFDNSDSVTARWSVSSEDDTEDVKVANVNDDGVIVLTVVNEAGTRLPSTGGMGTKIFHVVGIVLMLGAAVLLITKKRMGKME